MEICTLVLVSSMAVCRGSAIQAPRPTAAPTAGSAVPEFVARIEHDVGGKPEFLAAGDVDGDGRVDLVIALQAPGELLIARGGVTDSIELAERIPIGAYPLRPQIVRLRGEAGARDRIVVAVASRSTRKLQLLDVSRRGEPAKFLERELPGVPLAIASGNLGGEDTAAESDAVVVALDDHQMFVQVGARDPERSEGVLRGDLPRCLARTDSGWFVGYQNLDALDVLYAEPPRTFDLGGVPRDIVACTLAGQHGFAVACGDRSVRWWSKYGTDQTQFETAPVPVRVLAREVDAERGVELVTLSYAGDACELWQAKKADVHGISFVRNASYYVGQTPTDMAIDDFGGNGLPDLAVADRDAQRVSLLTRTKEGFFRSAPSARVGSFPSRVRALRSKSSCAGLVVLDAKEGTLSFVTGTARSWSEAQRLRVDPPPRLVECADLDGDGVDEVVVLAGTTNETELRIFSLSAGRLVARDIGEGAKWSGSTSAMIVVDEPTMHTIWYVDADRNRLGRVDIVRDPTRGLVIRSPREFELAGAPKSLALMRERDRPDRLAITSGARSRIAIAPIDAEMTSPVHVEQEVECAGSLLEVRAADFDGDGVLDLAVLTRTDEHSMQGQVHVFRANKGRFAESTVLTTGSSAFHLACKDVDGDGRADIVVPCQDSHAVDLFWSRPADAGLAFVRRPALGAGLGCIDVDFGDLDGDGLPDLVVANSSSDDVSLLFNRTSQ